jgi:hypothetical protein
VSVAEIYRDNLLISLARRSTLTLLARTFKQGSCLRSHFAEYNEELIPWPTLHIVTRTRGHAACELHHSGYGNKQLRIVWGLVVHDGRGRMTYHESRRHGGARYHAYRLNAYCKPAQSGSPGDLRSGPRCWREGGEF